MLKHRRLPFSLLLSLGLLVAFSHQQDEGSMTFPITMEPVNAEDILNLGAKLQQEIRDIRDQLAALSDEIKSKGAQFNIYGMIANVTAMDSNLNTTIQDMTTTSALVSGYKNDYAGYNATIECLKLQCNFTASPAPTTPTTTPAPTYPASACYNSTIFVNTTQQTWNNMTDIHNLNCQWLFSYVNQTAFYQFYTTIRIVSMTILGDANIVFTDRDTNTVLLNVSNSITTPQWVGANNSYNIEMRVTMDNMSTLNFNLQYQSVDRCVVANCGSGTCDINPSPPYQPLCHCYGCYANVGSNQSNPCTVFTDPCVDNGHFCIPEGGGICIPDTSSGCDYICLCPPANATAPFC